jgi:NitT/TauT family transport system permease protein
MKKPRCNFFPILKVIINRLAFLALVAAIWQAVWMLGIFPELLFPSLGSIGGALLKGFTEESLSAKILFSLGAIFQGMFYSIVIALVLTGISLTGRVGLSIVDNLITFLNPIPGMAIFPLCILFFGLGRSMMLVIIVHSVLWGVLISIITGIRSVNGVYREIGLNLELSRLRMLWNIYIPASIPHVMSGLRIGMSRAWRTAISVEILAGIASNQAGLGTHMNFQRNTMNISGLFASIIVISVVGIFLEEAIFKNIENITVRRWGEDSTKGEFK